MFGKLTKIKAKKDNTTFLEKLFFNFQLFFHKITTRNIDKFFQQFQPSEDKNLKGKN